MKYVYNEKVSTQTENRKYGKKFALMKSAFFQK